MIDGCGREIDHLRLSLTDYCNLACRYCVPTGLVRDSNPSPAGTQMIEAPFAFEVVRWLSQQHGIRHVRLTGGEPLLYPDLMPLIEQLARLDTLHEITLTTNAQALRPTARALRNAGLSRVNISLDTISSDRFAHITRGGNLAHTLAVIEAAVDAGLTTTKINVVVQRGINDDELPDIAQWGLLRGCVVRFLEVMPIGPMGHVVDRHLVPASVILERLADRFDLRPIPSSIGQPATDYSATGEKTRGVIGVIAPTSRPFCWQCRRIRITSQGRIIACVHDRKHFDLNRWWDGCRLNTSGADATLREAVQGKPEVGPRNQSITMLSLGG